jgi:DNA-binding CsgD family transcriptional regulator
LSGSASEIPITANGQDATNAIRATLTERELEIFERLASAKNNHYIAHERSLSTDSSADHIASILAELHLENRVQAAVQAVRAASPDQAPRRGTRHPQACTTLWHCLGECVLFGGGAPAADRRVEQLVTLVAHAFGERAEGGPAATRLGGPPAARVDHRPEGFTQPATAVGLYALDPQNASVLWELSLAAVS